MNKLNIPNTKEEIIDQEDDQKILEDAENIILKSNTYKKNTKKVFLFLLLPIFIFIILILLLSTIFALMNINSTKILDGISVQGIDVSNLTISEAKEKVNTFIHDRIKQEITVKHMDFETTISPEQFNVRFDVSSAINEAYSLGKSGNIFENNYTILNVLLKSHNISATIYYDEDLLNSIINAINDQLPDKLVQSDHYIDENNLIITSGKEGVVIDSSKFKQTILSSLITDRENLIIDIPVNNIKPNNIDIDTIYKETYKDPVDAYYTTNPYVVYPSSNGIDFNISLDEAKSLISNYQEEYIIPLKTLYPKVSTNQIGSEAFPDLLSEFTTSFSSSNYNRSTNIILSAEKINGTILMPGETFSYNEVVGQRTKEAGFKEASAYLNGEVVQEYGGGICQVSSTLYNAVLYANLEIAERTNHYFKPSYVKPSLDATVSWGGPDFKFVNNRNYPIRITCDSSGKTLRIYIHGLKTENDYKVVLESQYISTVYYKTTYKTDSSLESGTSRVIQSGSNGCKTAAYKYVYDSNGTLISSECISKDTYYPHNRIIVVAP